MDSPNPKTLPMPSLPWGAHGRLAILPCPGLRDGTGDAAALRSDLDSIRARGATVLVTLMEASELRALGLAGLGTAAHARALTWHHLPIVDYAVPGEAFEEAWTTVSNGLRAALDAGAMVALHCRGGLGRSGTIAARLLIESGMEPDRAVAAVRAARPGAIETAAQERYVLGLAACGERSAR